MMDLKGGSWVGGIYQKFEAMCSDMEEVLNEDTFKHVENQVRTVGNTVKKFYSDVMQDLNSLSSLDSVKAEDPLLTMVHQGNVKICKNQKVDGKNESVDAASEQLVKDFDGAAAFDDSIDYGSFCPGLCSVIDPCEPKSKNCAVCTEVVSKSHETESALIFQSSSMEKDLDSKSDSQNKCLSNLASIVAPFTNDSNEQVTSIAPHGESDQTSFVPGDVFLKEDSDVCDNEDDVGISLEVTEGYGNGNVVQEKKTIVLSDGLLSADMDNASVPSIACEFKRWDVDKHEVLVGEHHDEVRLEESCVLVDKYDQSSNLALEYAKKKSYKKKIQDVFSPRRWSRSKRDQEQVAAWYDQQREKNLLHSCSTLTMVSESVESDWELL